MNKYDYTEGSKAIFIEVVESSCHSVSKPEVFMIDDMEKDQIDDMFQELCSQREELSMQNYRGCAMKIVPEAPEGFLEKHLDDALSEMKYLQAKILWLQNAVKK